MTSGAATLSHPVRLRVLALYLGQLSLMMAALSIVPLGVALWFGDPGSAWRFGVVIVVMATLGVIAIRSRTPHQIQINEALLVVGLAFALLPLPLTLPLSASGLPYPDVLFETVSAITTTGLTTLESVEARSPTFLFTRAWMQWIGGLGIVVLSVALLMGHHAAVRRLAVPSGLEEFETTARTYARQVLLTYLVLTLIALAVLWPLLGDGFTALLHVFTSVATGGFSSFDQSIAAFDGWSPRIAIMLIALLGATPLALYARGAGTVLHDREVHALLVAVAAGILVLAAILWLSGTAPGLEALLHATVLGISAQTNTGFTSMPVTDLPPAALLYIVFAMFVGGAAGSTAGGIKLGRFLILLALIRLALLQTSLPSRAVSQARVGGHVIDADQLRRALTVIALFALTIVISWLILVAAGYPALQALFEVTSATATVGLTTGITGPDLPAWLKGLLMIDMLLGRVEIVALLLIMYPPTWLGRRRHER
jgi:trk system potassium uptake protein TrkH